MARCFSEVRHLGQFVRLSKRPQNFLVDLIADIGLSLERGHVGKYVRWCDGDGATGE
jgi:hypothetical protein